MSFLNIPALTVQILLFHTDDNIKFHENCRKFSRRVENTVEKGEIARYEQFLLFPQCFQKTCSVDTLKPGLVWERVISHHFGEEHCKRCFRFNPFYSADVVIFVNYCTFHEYANKVCLN